MVQVNDRLLYQGAIYRVTGPIKTIESMWGDVHTFVPVELMSKDGQPSIRGLLYPEIMDEQRWAVESTDGRWWRQMPDEFEIRDRQALRAEIAARP